MGQQKFPLATYVTAKPGTTADGKDLSAYGGKIIEFLPKMNAYELELDAQTLNSLDAEEILRLDDQGYETTTFILHEQDLIIAERRGTEEERQLALSRIDEILGIVDEEALEKQYFERSEQLSKAFEAHLLAGGTEAEAARSMRYAAELVLEVAYNYGYAGSVEEWTPDTMYEVCYYIPRKVSAEPAFFETIVDEMVAFLRYLAKEDHLIKPDELIQYVASYRNKIPAMAQDPANWGLAKSMMMGAQESGIDPTDRGQLNAYLNQLNAQRFAALPAPSSVEAKEFVPTPYDHLQRNERITVVYPDGKRKENVKFKFVEADLKLGRCELEQ